MNDQRFDELSKALATSFSRRKAIKGFAAAAAGGALTLAGARPASAARCRDPGEVCRANADCCERVCAQTSETRRECVCPSGTQVCPGTRRCVPVCTGGKVFDSESCECECPPTTTACGSVCCSAGLECRNGQCLQPCPTGTVPCGNTCCAVGTQLCLGNQCCTATGASCSNVPCCSGLCIFGMCF